MKVMLLLVRSAELAVERHVIHPVHVKRGAERGERSEEPYELSDAREIRRRPRGRENLVLREESCCERKPGDCIRCELERPPRLRNLLLEAAHFPDVLLPAHRVDHRARPEEQ